MTTFVGTQKNFTDAIKNLIELDFDAVEAYSAAINNITNSEYKTKLTEFMADHQQHITRLSEILLKHDEQPPVGPCAKQWLTKGKVAIAQLMGDKAILQAMLDNEEDTNLAYARMHKRLDQWNDAKETIDRGMHDELRHKEWLKSAIAESNNPAAA